MVNTQSKIADVYEANMKGVRALESKGLIDTVEEMQERGPWITVKGLVATVTMIDLFLERKLDTKQKPASKRRRLLSFIASGRPRVGGEPGVGAHNLGLRPDMIQSQIGPK